ncbi:MAG TPA: GlxA family transcriptional regulator [Polyangiaceae bacterium]|nr:GlxA family transcriptional regulator [Polyangiaceae bacterium]
MLVTYDDGNGVDLVGPAEVFARANSVLREAGRRHPGYATTIVAPHAGPVTLTAGLRIVPDGDTASFRGPIDTLVVTGGSGSRALAKDEAFCAWISKQARRARRYGSVCTGAFVLAAAGLLDGRRAATHWIAAAELAANYPRVHVDAASLFVKEGNLFTSAGVSAAIDLALALVEDDLGADVALAIARYMVLYLRRPGDQSQYSAPLRLQQTAAPEVRDLISWATEHPAHDLSVSALARRIGMSARQLSRVFKTELGESPARAVEALRVEAAEHALISSRASLDEVAAKTGFQSAEVMRRAFLRITRINPSDYRARFGASRSDSAHPAQEEKAS